MVAYTIFSLAFLDGLLRLLSPGRSWTRSNHRWRYWLIVQLVLLLHEPVLRQLDRNIVSVERIDMHPFPSINNVFVVGFKQNLFSIREFM